MCEASACVGTRYIAVNVIKISQPTNLLPLLPTAPPPSPPPLSIFVVAVLIIIIITNTTRFFLVAEVVGFFLFVAPGGVLKK